MPSNDRRFYGCNYESVVFVNGRFFPPSTRSFSSRGRPITKKRQKNSIVGISRNRGLECSVSVLLQRGSQSYDNCIKRVDRWFPTDVSIVGNVHKGEKMNQLIPRNGVPCRFAFFQFMASVVVSVIVGRLIDLWW